MSKTQVLLISAMASLLFWGCGAEDSQKTAKVNQSTTTENYSYSFEYNGCATGSHSFSSLADMCNGLKDSALNKGCAIDLRKAYFAEKCPGQTFL